MPLALRRWKSTRRKKFAMTTRTMATTAAATAILEAGRRSLDAKGRPFALVYEDDTAQVPVGIKPVEW